MHDIGQSLWLDNFARDGKGSEMLARHIEKLSVTGITSSTAMFDEAFANSVAYDAGVRQRGRNGESDDTLFTGLALEELRRAAHQLLPVFAATDGLDGWVSMEVSPLLADDSTGTLDAALRIFRQAGCPNLFIMIPGTPAGIPAIEESVFEGIPVHVSMLFSREQYLAAAGAYYRGLARRLRLGRHPDVASVASVVVNRWDSAVNHHLPPGLRHRLGIAIADVSTAPIATYSRPPLEQAGRRGRTPAAPAVVGHRQRCCRCAGYPVPGSPCRPADNRCHA